MSELTIDQLREQHERIQIENEMARLQAETAAINGACLPGMHLPEAAPLQEAWGDMVQRTEHPGGGWDGAQNVRGDGLWDTTGAMLGDRRFGQDEQVFQNEIEHARIRAIGRLLCNKSVNARAVQKNLVSHILGVGFSYKAVPGEDQTPNDGLMKAIQKIIRQVQADNKWWKRERQWFKRSRRDGEFFVALYHVGGGRVQLRTLEPEQISEPDDVEQVIRYFGLPDRPYNWRFGICTDDDDMEAVHGYAVKWKTEEGRDTLDWVPANKIVHCKQNVDENIKRGVSDYYAVYEHLIDSAKLVRNTVKGHAIMAAIAFIREHAQGVTQPQVESMRANSAWSRYQQVTRTEGSRTRFTHHYSPGTVIDVGKDTQYKPSPMAEQGVGKAMVEVNHAVLQIAGTNWCMPDYMISGNASKAAYSATLVAESPFVKFCEGEQLDTAEELVEIFWKAIEIAHEAGVLDEFGLTMEEIRELIKIKTGKPIVAARDRNVETNRRKILCDDGILSEETWAEEEGYRYEEEKKRGAKRKETQAPFVGGDQPGKSVQGADKKKAEGSLREHMGPGPHSSGSDQDVHGDNGGKRRYGKYTEPNLSHEHSMAEYKKANKLNDEYKALSPAEQESEKGIALRAKRDKAYQRADDERTGKAASEARRAYYAKEDAAKAERNKTSVSESRLSEAAAILWGSYPDSEGVACVTEGKEDQLESADARPANTQEA